MAKIAQVSAKYIIHATINIDGVVDRPDVIGAIFGQTEGLLGEDLELRELQKSGRIGRIEVTSDNKGGKTNGEIIIPSSLDKAETAIIAAALEVIQRIGPCNAKLEIKNIEDIRVSKRKQVVDRAKILLRDLIEGVMPDSQEIADEVAYSVRVMEIQTYGRERLSAGPNIDESDEVIVVEGRADVLNLLKYGFKNAIAVGGTGVPKTIAELCKEKTVTVFVDGDRGGDLIIKELMSLTEIDFACKAPDGKEVEELTKKEIHKALRGKVTGEQFALEHATNKPEHHTRKSSDNKNSRNDKTTNRKNTDRDRRDQSNEYKNSRSDKTTNRKSVGPSENEKEQFNKMLEDLIGTRGAYILDKKLEILGKIPVSELANSIKSLHNAIYAVVFDGSVEQELLDVSEKSNVKFLVAMSNTLKVTGKTKILTPNELNA
ncbi:MAG: DNA primase DnaG [Candidatus Nanoarchaeia archaeon]